MEFYWAEVGSKAVSWRDCGYDLVSVFYCPDCGEWDNVFIDPKFYEWLEFEGTIDFDDPELELSEFVELLAEDCLMRELFANRPYLAIPAL
ncbi:hypothetical protein KJ853_02235 [Patescibacteria group bacterium]|nr:hypothetical protein [Patescibacteria group bacterium]